MSANPINLAQNVEKYLSKNSCKQRTLGIIGGMSWESTESYYRLINEGIKARLGNLHSADLLIHSVDFAPIEALQAQGARAEVHRIIYEELCQGQLLDSSRQYYQQVTKNLADKGAKGVILGCTEIGLLIQQADSPISVFDTTAIHAAAAVDFLLSSWF